MSPPTQDPKRLRRRRIEAGLNKKELAMAAGIHPSYVTWLERGDRGASPRVLKRLSKALQCEIADLMPPEPNEDEEAGAV
ncbi:helix-turn-helix domain-containing protein [Streptomyces cylindrosporus]|uniref:Helix-turn-helix transcriptional regulator n=1 Tax=Streptomyces cylindrosporus TaxID=2927583 RepID=A0ABS9Y2M6_9ACTN|nr:helix-turn-helix transcriptional regulator [Streptomyces cylindrosporus]MCI3271440.1 helix-turn-helix transcriptional regulator [Streptomyces cylindrosporus]